MEDAAASAAQGRKLQVEHLVIDEEFKDESGGPRVVEGTADDDGTVRGVEVSQYASGFSQAPTDLHAPQAARKITAV